MRVVFLAKQVAVTKKTLTNLLEKTYETTVNIGMPFRDEIRDMVNDDGTANIDKIHRIKSNNEKLEGRGDKVSERADFVVK